MLIEKPPSAKNQAKTLRTIGYSLNSAAADIIDNSIAASAREVRVDLIPKSDEDSLSLEISFLDDGVGMSEEALLTAMQIACKDPDADREDGDLGRFGTGLKTASFSQARKLTVISREDRGEVAGAVWDLDLIEASDQWLLENISKSIDEKDFSFLTHGTRVTWERVDTIDETSNFDDFLEQLNSISTSLSKHLSIHFHKYLENGLKIVLNGTPLKPINPFMTGVKGYQSPHSPDKLRSKLGTVYLTAHHLPDYKNLTPKEKGIYGTPEEVSNAQGLYIYRNSRLISAGSWHGITPKSSETAQLRVEVDFSSSQDSLWKTDLKKDSIKIPHKIRQKISNLLKRDFKIAKGIKNYRPRVKIDTDYWIVKENEQTGDIEVTFKKDNYTLQKILKALPDEERKTLGRLLVNAAQDIPFNEFFSRYKGR